jgi:glycosyltransferase involved in cell wall biosynthesis
LEFGNTKGIKKLVLTNIRLILTIFFKDLLNRENRIALQRPKAYFNEIIRLLYESNVLQNELRKHNNGGPFLYYTYWFYTWTNLLSVIKKAKDKLITRSHGYDFNLERNGNGYFPFRPFAWSQIDVNYNVSNFGANYLVKHYPKRKDKIKVSYLGVKYQKVLSSFNGVNVVSCSNLIPLKRVHLIVGLLKCIKKPIHWVHFGDGSEMERIVQLCKTLPSNVTYDLKGAIKNREILEFYREIPVSAFIHLSESEGLPVSMMEAQSFGIPILACDVGGVGEIVNEYTGVLIPKDFNIESAAQELDNIRRFNMEKRKVIQLNQKKVFSAEKNYSSFVDEIKREIK